MRKHPVKRLVSAAVCLALGVALPMVFHLFGAGSAFLPMHIPVLLCGFVCGWPFGALCGLVTPLLSSALTGMPPLFPTALSMTFELAAYGALTGLLYGKKLGVYPSLIAAMLGGRVVSGAATAILMGVSGNPYGFGTFLTGAFVTALPGIAIQLVLIPVLVAALEKSGFMGREKTPAAAQHS